MLVLDRRGGSLFQKHEFRSWSLVVSHRPCQLGGQLEMKLLYLNQCMITYIFVLIHAIRAATHWIVTEDGKIHTQEDTVFQMKRPYDLMSFLQQEQRSREFVQIKQQLLKKKQAIEKYDCKYIQSCDI